MVTVFLAGLITSINSQIRGSILSEGHLPTLSATFAVALQVVGVVMAQDVVKDVTVNPSLYVSIARSIVIIWNVVSKSLVNKIELPILPLLKLHSLHHMAL